MCRLCIKKKAACSWDACVLVGQCHPMKHLQNTTHITCMCLHHMFTWCVLLRCSILWTWTMQCLWWHGAGGGQRSTCYKGISSRADTREWSPEPYRAVWHEERGIWGRFPMRTLKLWWMTCSQSQCLQRIHNFGCCRLCGRQNGNVNAITCIHARPARET